VKIFLGCVLGFLIAMALVQSDTVEKRFAIATGLVIGAIVMLLLSVFNVNAVVYTKTIEEEKKNDHWWKNGEKPPWES
jgi:uncharacterized membrane protein